MLSPTATTIAASGSIDLCCASALLHGVVLDARAGWQQLRTLAVTHVGLTSLAALGGALATCVALESLSLSHNRLVDVPLGMLGGGTSALTSLDLSHNRLDALPAAVREMTALRELRVRHNRLDTLPLFNINVALHSLDLSSNHFGEWPAALDETLLRACRQLLLADNKLTLVPALLLARLPALEYLSLHGNALAHIDARLESPELLVMLRALRNSANSPRAVRVLLLGKQRVGKSS